MCCRHRVCTLDGNKLVPAASELAWPGQPVSVRQQACALWLLQFGRPYTVVLTRAPNGFSSSTTGKAAEGEQFYRTCVKLWAPIGMLPSSICVNAVAHIFPTVVANPLKLGKVGSELRRRTYQPIGRCRAHIMAKGRRTLKLWCRSFHGCKREVVKCVCSWSSQLQIGNLASEQAQLKTTV